MSAFKLILSDIREGILRNKRYILVPILCLFECMSADINLNMFKAYGGIKSPTTFLDLIAELFHGCDPITKAPDPSTVIALPYFWIALFVFAVFINFDYMHNDLTQFGIQVLTRSRKRGAWWGAKCVWCIASGVWFYMLFLLTALLFSVLNGYDITFTNTPDILTITADRSVVYLFKGAPDLTVLQRVWLLLAPMLVLCTLNMLQMLLCLFCKPMYSYLISIGVLMFGVLDDTPAAFSRCAMTTRSDWFYEEAYPAMTGMWICLGLIAAVIIAGALYFKRYDILPDKE